MARSLGPQHDSSDTLKQESIKKERKRTVSNIFLHTKASSVCVNHGCCDSGSFWKSHLSSCRSRQPKTAWFTRSLNLISCKKNTHNNCLNPIVVIWQNYCIYQFYKNHFHTNHLIRCHQRNLFASLHYRHPENQASTSICRRANTTTYEQKKKYSR